MMWIILFVVLIIFSWLQLVSSTCDSSGAIILGKDLINSVPQQNWGKMLADAYNFVYECQSSLDPKCLSEYDITINGNWTYLRDLGDNGWMVKLANYLQAQCDIKDNIFEIEKCINDLVNIDGCYVAWTGGFNKGKTTMLNLILSDKEFPSGYGKDGETKGFNFILPKGGSKVIHIDTPGATRCVKPIDLQDRFMTDTFVYDVLPDIADIIILVVDILTSNEQVLINQLMDKLISFTTAKHPKKLYIIHNFKTLAKIQDVEQYIISDIIDAFIDTEKIRNDDKIIYYTSKYKEYQINHYVFAQQHTEAGNYYNEISQKWLHQHTNQMQCNSRGVNILQHFIDKLEPLMVDYFYSQKITKEMVVAPEFDIWTAAKVRTARWMQSKKKTITGAVSNLAKYLGINKWAYGYDDDEEDDEDGDGYGVLDIDDIKSSDPFKLIFKASLTTYYSGIIKLNISRDLEYCQSTEIGETPQCRPKLQCDVFEQPEIWGVQCKIPDIELGDNIETFNEDIGKKLFVLTDEDKCELIIKGRILPPWRNFVGDDINKFQLLRVDGSMHGWVEERFQMKNRICTKFHQSKHKIDYQTGMLTITVQKKK